METRIIDNIRQEFETLSKNISTSKSNQGALQVLTANEYVQIGLQTPNPRTYFHGLIAEGENTVIFACTNKGKSILAVQIADEISKETKVLYVDLEHNTKQFQKRYASEEGVHKFNDNFFRAEIKPDKFGDSEFSEAVFASIENNIVLLKIKVVILDNITFLCERAEKGEHAIKLMHLLIRFNRKYSLTIIVIGHTPKRSTFLPLTVNDLAGSSKLMGLFDAGIAIGESAKDSSLRYIKQVKVRSSEMIYDTENVLVCEQVMSDNWLHFEIKGTASEYEHLTGCNSKAMDDQMRKILDLLESGKSYREIAESLGITLGAVQRRIRKAKNNDFIK